MADNLNTDNNNLRMAQNLSNTIGGRESAEAEKFTKDKQIRVVSEVAPPNYSKWTRTVTGTPPDDSAPTSDSAFWDLRGYMGASGYISFTGGALQSATVELWCKDASNQKAFRVAYKTNVRNCEEFRFPDEVRQRECFFRVTDVSAGVTSLLLVVSPE